MGCACGTALSKDRLSVLHGPSGLVGRVLELGHAAGEPIVAGRSGSGVRQVFMGVDDARRIAKLVGGAVTVGDVAAGGRGARLPDGLRITLLIQGRVLNPACGCRAVTPTAGVGWRSLWRCRWLGELCAIGWGRRVCGVSSRS